MPTLYWIFLGSIFIPALTLPCYVIHMILSIIISFLLKLFKFSEKLAKSPVLIFVNFVLSVVFYFPYWKDIFNNYRYYSTMHLKNQNADILYFYNYNLIGAFVVFIMIFFLILILPFTSIASKYPPSGGFLRDSIRRIRIPLLIFSCLPLFSLILIDSAYYIATRPASAQASEPGNAHEKSGAAETIGFAVDIFFKTWQCPISPSAAAVEPFALADEGVRGAVTFGITARRLRMMATALRREGEGENAGEPGEDGGVQPGLGRLSQGFGIGEAAMRRLLLAAAASTAKAPREDALPRRLQASVEGYKTLLERVRQIRTPIAPMAETPMGEMMAVEAALTEGRLDDAEAALTAVHAAARAAVSDPVAPRSGPGVAETSELLGRLSEIQGFFSPAASHYLMAASNLPDGRDDARKAGYLAAVGRTSKEGGFPFTAEYFLDRSLAMGTEDAVSQVGTLALRASMLSEARRRGQATLLAARALELIRTTYGPKHPETAQALLVLADHYEVEGKIDGAFFLAVKAHVLWKELGKETDAGAAETLTHIGHLAAELGKPAEALVLHDCARRITEQALGTLHPDLNRILGAIAASHQAMGRHDEAIATLNRLVEVTRVNYGKRSAMMLASLFVLKRAYDEKGDAEGSASVMQEAAAIANTLKKRGIKP